MSLPLAEYRATRSIRESPRSQVYEAVSERDSRTVIAKVFDIEDETDEDRVQHEFELLRSLDFEGVVRAKELRRVGDQLVLLLEHVPGVNLAEFAGGRPLPLAAFWPIAIQIADILAQTHAARVIHRDIKPRNVLIHARSGRVYLADFGISVVLESERRHIYDTNVFVGTLPYISPEQTGRTSHAVDFRSDLYSLGISFYELLTGRLPFTSPAPLELIHAHLAREPAPPISVRPDLPEGLSRLIMKLLAKAPEHRYQTAAGLAADLRRLQAMHEAGRDDPDVELGSEDLATRVRLPHRLYGRERERLELVGALAEVATSGRRRTLALTGPIGVGKSALIGELEPAVAVHGGYLVRGRFDGARELPYSAFAEAFTALFEQILTESDARLTRWRRQLDEGLGNLAAVIAGLAPTLEFILGPVGAPPSIDTNELRNRMQIAIERLLAVVCADARPLVLVLEDLHHAGPGAVRLLEALVHGRRGPLLLVLTARADDLAADHPVRELVAGFTNEPQARTLELRGLAVEAVEALVSAALPGSVDVRPLARIIARKTNGVPLFVRQMLTQLAAAGLLRAQPPHGWEWDQARVEAEPIPADAVALVRARLESISVEARELVRRAACLGVRFDQSRLALVVDRPRAELTASLVELEDAGLLARVGAEHQFVHESVHQAAQQGLAEATRRRLHWTLGRELLASCSSDDRLFEIVDHLAAGEPAQLDDALRFELAELHLRAGSRALESGAYELAHAYLAHGIRLTAELRDAVVDWGVDARGYALVFRLHFTHAYSLALAGRRAEADRAFVDLIGWRLSDDHFGEVLARRSRLLWLEARDQEALDLGRVGLERLGVKVPRSPTLSSAMDCMVGAWTMVRTLDPASFEAMPRCEGPRRHAIVEIIAALKYAAFARNHNLFLYLAGLHVGLIELFGTHPTTPMAIADLALGVSGRLGKVAEAVQMIDLAGELARLQPTATAEARVLAIGGAMTLHRARPFADIVADFEPGYRRALEAGEFGAASFIGGFGADMQLEIGTHLRVLGRRCRRVAREVGRWCPIQMRVTVWMLRGVCLALLGPEAEQGEVGEVWNLDPEQLLEHGGAPTNHHMGIIAKAMVDLILGDGESALAACLTRFSTLETVVFNTWYVARAYVLTCAAYYVQVLAGAAPPPEAAAAVATALDTLESWARDGEANYGHYRDLALGLQAAAEDQPQRAARLLDRAWSRARKHGCRWVEGLAAERLALLLEHEQLGALVDGAWRRAWDAYAAWGAEAKLERLRRARPSVFGEHARRDAGRQASAERRREVAPPNTPAGRAAPAPDLAGVLRSVEAITEDLRLEEVIARVLDAALTNVGADHALLVLEQPGSMGGRSRPEPAHEEWVPAGSVRGRAELGRAESAGSSGRRGQPVGGGELTLVAEATTAGAPTIFADPPILREVGELAPVLLINFVLRTGKPVVLDDARSDLRFADDPYLERAEVRSVLALPLVKGERRFGALVLENRLTTHSFNPTSIEALRLITSQAASTLENAQLYSALRRSEARWRSLVDGAPDLIALLDEGGRVVFRNHEGPLTGVDETQEEDSDGCLQPESALRWRDAVTTVLGAGERRELELEYAPAAGPSRWYAVRLAPIEVHRTLGHGGELDSVRRNAVAVATDISERKQAEADKRLLEAQLRQQQRLESVGTLASGVAHEINNPIQGIMNYADLIYSNSREPELVEDFAGEITHESNRVAAIVRNLLAFSRQDAGAEPEATRLGEVVEATLSLVRAVLRRDHIKVTVDVEPDLPLVPCRAQQIQQVVMNLVTNARDALKSRYDDDYDERKCIEIRVEASTRPRGAEGGDGGAEGDDDPRGERKPTGAEGGDGGAEGDDDPRGERKPTWVCVSVRDTGSGIAPEVLPRIFDPFFTTKGRDEGTGLGLAVSHGIAADHGGELSVETTLGVGTCFRLELPTLGG